jgi:hypothetical protein
MKPFKVTKVNEEFVRNHDAKNYNEYEWNKQVDRILKYKDVEFYIAENDRFFVEYTLPEGLRLWGDFGYGASLTNGGFYRLDKLEVTKDGRTFSDLHKLLTQNKEEASELWEELQTSDLFEVRYGYFFQDGEKVLFGTSKEARIEMTRRSKEAGVVFTKG